MRICVKKMAKEEKEDCFTIIADLIISICVIVVAVCVVLFCGLLLYVIILNAFTPDSVTESFNSNC